MCQEDNLILSATAVVLKEASQGFEVLLLQRNQAISVHGGSWVFPGGKADTCDIPSTVGKTDIRSLDEDEKHQVARISASRETFEEAGIKLDPKALKLCSRWVTPETMKKRFDAFFFLCQVDDEKVIIDDGEIKDYCWLSPSVALNKQANGLLTLPPPTFVTLSYLAQMTDCRQAIESMALSPITFRPKIHLTNTGFHSIYTEDSGYESTRLAISSPTHRLVIENGKFEYLRDF